MRQQGPLLALFLVLGSFLLLLCYFHHIVHQHFKYKFNLISVYFEDFLDHDA